MGTALSAERAKRVVLTPERRQGWAGQGQGQGQTRPQSLEGGGGREGRLARRVKAGPQQNLSG